MLERDRLFPTLTALVAVVLLCAVSSARAQEEACRAHFADRPVRWIVPSSPGGGYDIYSRLIEPFYERALGAEIVVENRPGAGGLSGMLAIRDASPDGGTLGILDGSGLLVARLAGDAQAPDLATDFTLLGRIARGQYVWAVSSGSGLESLADAIARAEQRPLVLAVRDAGSTAFVVSAVSTSLLGVERKLVAGYRGSREASLAAIRGDVDMVVYNYESLRDRVVSGELRLLLQVADTPISEDPLLAGVPLLGGAEGAAARRATLRGGDAAEAIADASALAAVSGAGRLVAAPPGLDAQVGSCMERALHAVLFDPDFAAAAAAAGRSIDAARSDQVRAEIQAAAARAERFLPIIRSAIREVRE